MLAVGAVAFACLAAGCGISPERLAREVTPPAVEGALDTAAEPDSRQEIADILSDPRIKEALSELAGSLASKGLETMSRQAREAEIRQAVAELALAIAPAVRELAGEAADAAIQDALSQQNRMLASAFVSDLMQTSADALARNLRQALGPALEDVLRDDIAPGLITQLDGPLGGAVIRLSERLSRRVVLSAREAITAPGPGELGTLIDRAQGAIMRAELTIALLSANLLVLLGILILLIREGRHRQRITSKGEAAR